MWAKLPLLLPVSGHGRLIRPKANKAYDIGPKFGKIDTCDGAGGEVTGSLKGGDEFEMVWGFNANHGGVIQGSIACLDGQSLASARFQPLLRASSEANLESYEEKHNDMHFLFNSKADYWKCKKSSEDAMNNANSRKAEFKAECRQCGSFVSSKWAVPLLIAGKASCEKAVVQFWWMAPALTSSGGVSKKEFLTELGPVFVKKGCSAAGGFDKGEKDKMQAWKHCSTLKIEPGTAPPTPTNPTNPTVTPSAGNTAAGGVPGPGTQAVILPPLTASTKGFYFCAVLAFLLL